MTLFRSNTHRDVWIGHWCERCYHGKQKNRCPILARALQSGRKPPQWDRMPRADEMHRTIKCNAYQDKPPITRRGVADAEDVPMFDVTPAPEKLIPVDGWPDKPTKDGVDHA